MLANASTILTEKCFGFYLQNPLWQNNRFLDSQPNCACCWFYV